MSEPFEEADNLIARIARMEQWWRDGVIKVEESYPDAGWAASVCLMTVTIGTQKFTEDKRQYPSEAMVAQVALAAGAGLTCEDDNDFNPRLSALLQRYKAAGLRKK